MKTFETPGPVRLVVEIQSGRIEVTAEDIQQTRIELRPVDQEAQALIDRAEIRQDGDRILVLLPREQGGFSMWGSRRAVEAIIHVPLKSIARLATGSGRVETHGVLGDVAVRTGSGRIVIESGAAVDLKTGSGNVELRAAGGYVDAKTGSGQIDIGEAAQDAKVMTGSGNISVGRCAGSLKAVTGSGNIELGDAGEGVDVAAASGRITIRRVSKGHVRANATSGRVSVGIARGTAAWLDLHTMTGRVDSALDPTDAPSDGDARAELRIKTVSGSIELTRAEAPAHA